MLELPGRFSNKKALSNGPVDQRPPVGEPSPAPLTHRARLRSGGTLSIINITLDPSLSTAGSEDGERDGGVEQIGRISASQLIRSGQKPKRPRSTYARHHLDAGEHNRWPSSRMPLRSRRLWFRAHEATG